MKRYIAVFALCALTVLGLGSCVRPVEENLQAETASGHTVTFDAALANQTRTGLMFKFVPCWINTEVENVHLFETLASTGRTDEGTDTQMEIVEGTNNEVARFTAQFGEATDIFVNTRSGEEDTYTAIVAQCVKGAGEDPDVYVIPAEQTPDAVSLIDPNADFLIGKGVNVTAGDAGKQVDLDFTRPVAVSRLAIMNMGGTKVRSVTITSTDKLTGSAAYSAIDFETGAVTFDPESGSATLTISYGDGAAMDETKTFYAYFISAPGTKHITRISVLTDQNSYTKTFDGEGRAINFTAGDFKNIAVDMSQVEPGLLEHYYQKVTSADEIVEGGSYLIVYNPVYQPDSYRQPKLFKPTLNNAHTGFTAAAANAVDVAVLGGQYIEGTDAIDACRVFLKSQNSSEFSVYVPAVKRYLLPHDGSNALVATEDAADARSTVTLSSGNVSIAANNYVVRYGTGSNNNYFAASNSSTNYAVPAFFKLVEGETPDPVAQTITLSQTEVSGGVGAVVAPPYVLGNQTSLSFSSSAEDVATVDENGALSLLSAGTATITVKAVAEHGYAEDSKTYTVTVTDASAAHYYQKVTALSELTAGTSILFVYENGTSSKVFKPVLNKTGNVLGPVFTESNTANALTAAVSDGVILPYEAVDACQLVLQDTKPLDNANGNKFGLQVPAYGVYFFHPNIQGTLSRAFAADLMGADYRTTFTYSNNEFTLACAGSGLYYRTANQYFRSSSSDGVKPAIYKAVSGQIAQTLSFDPDEVEGYPGVAVTAPTLSGAKTTVSYTSSDASIAEVNETSGALTLKATGTVTITATAAASGAYAEGSASYTLTVKPLRTQTLVFTPTEASGEIGATITPPALTGNETAVTYSSSATDIASVNATTGALTLKAVGSATITATAAEADGWAEASASYTLTVTAPAPVTIPLKKATSLTAGKKYVLVSNGYALMKNGSSAEAVAFNSNDKTITVPSTMRDNVLWTLGQKSGTITRGNEYAFTNGDDFFGIAMYTGVNPYEYTVVVNEGRTVSTNNTIQDHNVSLTGDLIYYAGSSSNYYIYYDATSSAWVNAKLGNTLTPADNNKTALYVVDEPAHYTKVNALSELPTDSDNPQGDFILVYESGNKAYVFNAICPSEPTAAGNYTGDVTETNHPALTKSGSAIEVDLTSNGIEATAAVTACKIQFKKHGSNNSRYIYVGESIGNLSGYWLRLYSSNNVASIRAMTSSGYGSTLTFNGTGNNLTVARDGVYISYNASDSCFEASISSANVSLYKLSE